MAESIQTILNDPDTPVHIERPRGVDLSKGLVALGRGLQKKDEGIDVSGFVRGMEKQMNDVADARRAIETLQTQADKLDPNDQAKLSAFQDGIERIRNNVIHGAEERMLRLRADFVVANPKLQGFANSITTTLGGITGPDPEQDTLFQQAQGEAQVELTKTSLTHDLPPDTLIKYNQLKTDNEIKSEQQRSFALRGGEDDVVSWATLESANTFNDLFEGALANMPAGGYTSSTDVDTILGQLRSQWSSIFAEEVQLFREESGGVNVRSIDGVNSMIAFPEETFRTALDAASAPTFLKYMDDVLVGQSKLEAITKLPGMKASLIAAGGEWPEAMKLYYDTFMQYDQWFKDKGRESIEILAQNGNQEAAVYLQSRDMGMYDENYAKHLGDFARTGLMTGNVYYDMDTVRHGADATLQPNVATNVQALPGAMSELFKSNPNIYSTYLDPAKAKRAVATTPELLPAWETHTVSLFMTEMEQLMPELIDAGSAVVIADPESFRSQLKDSLGHPVQEFIQLSEERGLGLNGLTAMDKMNKYLTALNNMSPEAAERMVTELTQLSQSMVKEHALKDDAQVAQTMKDMYQRRVEAGGMHLIYGSDEDRAAYVQAQVEGFNKWDTKLTTLNRQRNIEKTIQANTIARPAFSGTDLNIQNNEVVGSGVVESGGKVYTFENGMIVGIDGDAVDPFKPKLAPRKFNPDTGEIE
jgi:hypothetical protein